MISGMIGLAKVESAIIFAQALLGAALHRAPCARILSTRATHINQPPLSNTKIPVR
jgi:hypothetical protein